MLLRSSRGRRKSFKVERRAPNEHRNRWAILQKISRMSDAFFKRYFRMDRASFQSLLETIKDHITKDITKAVNSSGSPIHPSIKLAIALRYLAGGSYLDLAFGFNIAYKGIMVYVWEVYQAIDMNMNNINFPFDNVTSAAGVS